MRNRIVRNKLTRRGFLLLTLAGVAEFIYLKEMSQRVRKEGSHQAAGFTPVFVRPSQVLDLAFWKISLPTGNQQVAQPELSGFYNDAFRVVEAVQFTAPCGGRPQPGSKYPRSELRELNADGSPASWSTISGTHTMDLTQRVTHLPLVKPQVVCGQIHAATEYLILTELENHRLYVRYKDEIAGVLDDNYQLGTYFDMRIQAARGYVDVFYNGAHMVRQAMDADGCYFKAGCYVQSNTSTGDLPTAYGQVEISRLLVSHS
jgi:alginate lyase